MTEEQTRKAAQNVIYLAGCAAKGIVPELTGLEDTGAIFAYARKHRLTAAVAMALESAGRADRSTTFIIADALKRKFLFETAYAQVKAKLEEAGILYLPLKGMILKDYYPKPGMREMGDYDILFDANRAEDVKAIMEELGFETESFGKEHHDCYRKSPFLEFEMHRTLFGLNHDELYDYYLDVEKRLLGDKYEKHLSTEDFYLYVTAHEYKHYICKGTGLRSLLDTYVYLQKEKLDMAYVTAEAEKLGMADFESANRALAQRLFSNEALTESDREMLDYILSSGVYGTADHRVKNKMSEQGWGKLRYALDRFLVPVSRKNKKYAYFAGRFPFFYQHKILLPFLPFYRTYCAMKEGRLLAEAKAVKNAKK